MTTATKTPGRSRRATTTSKKVPARRTENDSNKLFDLITDLIDIFGAVTHSAYFDHFETLNVEFEGSQPILQIFIIWAENYQDVLSIHVKECDPDRVITDVGIFTDMDSFVSHVINKYV